MQPVFDDVVAVNVQSLYDTATIPAAGIAQLSFFQTPRGGAGGNFTAAATAKSYGDTNLEVAGMLPTGYNFKILGFRLQPAHTLTQQDATRWSVGAWFTFWMGSVPQLRMPADSIPAGTGPSGFFTQAVAANASLAAHGWPEIHNGYNIGRKPIDILQGVNFFATIDWPTATAVTSTVPAQPAAGLPVRCYLDGFYYRARS